MQPIGPLMIEHRLIERMIALIRRELRRIEQTSQADPVFIETVVDFIRTYADRTHHGKEEDILFRVLAKKEMSHVDKRVMDELIEEHVSARKMTGELVDAKSQYQDGDKSSLAVIAEKLRMLSEFYPEHIEKEDRVFFPASMNYLSNQEKQSMLNEFWEFDRKMIHEKYKSFVKTLQKG